MCVFNYLKYVNNQTKIFHKSTTFENPQPSLLVWLRDWSIILFTKGMKARLPVRARIYVLGLIPSQGRCKRQPIDVSLFLSPLSSFSKINKHI